MIEQTAHRKKEFEPKIIGFLCNWCAYEGADAAGRAKLSCPANVKIIRVMCTGSVDPEFVVEAFKQGADGVLLLGCHPGHCHYKNGNMTALARNILQQKTLAWFGIEPERIKIEWVSAKEGPKFAALAHDMVQLLKKMGPLHDRVEPYQKVKGNL